MYWVYNNNVIEARILMINSSMGWAVWFDNVGVIWEYLLFFSISEEIPWYLKSCYYYYTYAHSDIRSIYKL